jgi:hypothetical protein
MLTKNGQITDSAGRVLILRGCNLGGDGKIALSYEGYPFPIEEADERFAELASWGLTFNRLPVLWEALEPEGPGIYDESYLAYLRKLLLAAEKRGISFFIDPHQDVWGRAAGGDGAPDWTLEAAGMDCSRLEAAGAILPGAVREITPPDKRPLMTWPAGNNRYAAATMFSLFFGGKVFAPGCQVEGENIQDWLQRHFIEAYAHCRRRLKNCKAIAGWGTMNEPHPGFIGYRDLGGLENNMVAVGPMPAAFQAMAAASGFAVEVPVYATTVFGVKRRGTATLNPQGVSVFKEGFQCPWKSAGVWDVGSSAAGAAGSARGQPRLLKPDYFSRVNGRPVSFAEDFLKPFIARFTARLAEADEGRAEGDKALFFIEGVPAGVGTGEDVASPSADLAGAEDSAGAEGSTGAAGSGIGSPARRYVHALHWYDGPTLFIKQFRPWFNFDVKKNKVVLGRKKVAALYRRILEGHLSAGMPNLVGEFGLPFDLFRGRAFRSGDYSVHEEALAMYYDALDDFLLGACIWDYAAGNSFRYGDRWNNEDFSIVSRDYPGRTRDLSACPLKPRAEKGWLRPYPAATAGTPLRFRWDVKKQSLVFRWRSDGAIEEPTEIFIPACLWEQKPVTAVAPGLRRDYDEQTRRLRIWNEGYSGEVEVTVKVLR